MATHCVIRWVTRDGGKEGMGVRPTLAAEELKRNLTQFLSTTFALADRPVREGPERFLNHPDRGIFRGPYLRIRIPFRPAGNS